MLGYVPGMCGIVEWAALFVTGGKYVSTGLNATAHTTAIFDIHSCGIHKIHLEPTPDVDNKHGYVVFVDGDTFAIRYDIA